MCLLVALSSAEDRPPGCTRLVSLLASRSLSGLPFGSAAAALAAPHATCSSSQEGGRQRRGGGRRQRGGEGVRRSREDKVHLASTAATDSAASLLLSISHCWSSSSIVPVSPAVCTVCQRRLQPQMKRACRRHNSTQRQQPEREGRSKQQEKKKRKLSQGSFIKIGHLYRRDS